MSLSDPVITVECDKCGCADEVRLTCTARGWDERDVPSQLKRLGYVEHDDGTHTCRDCTESDADALKGGAKDDGVTLCSAIAPWSTPEGGQVCEYDETHEGPHSWEEAQVDRDNAEYDRKRDALKGGKE